MFSLLERPTRLCDGPDRRELLRIGGLSVLGLSLPTLLQARLSEVRGRTFGRAKNVIFLWLQGGPPQHETFDPKPDAPVEIRGEFKPISTNVPGIRFCELLPRTAAMADKLAVLRGICTHSDLHDASGYWVMTGYRYLGTNSRKINPTDWPYLGSILKVLKPSKTLPGFTSVWLPDVMRLDDNVQPAGQTAGFLGKRWEPTRIIGDPSDPAYRVEGLALPPEVPPLRLSSRQSLLAQVDHHLAELERGGPLQAYDSHAQEAFAALTSGRARQAFDIGKEPVKVRERYGPGKWGQCVLLARRLIEAGARLVHVNWPREGGDTAVNNPMWDTHAQNADRLQDVLCPQFDVGFTALLEDLEQRGLLQETLVVAVGEFGRTPKINGNGGRDHWGHVFPAVLAGAGIRTGLVHGSSDKQGAYPIDGKHEPQDLTATILHLLGIGHDAFFPHPTGRPVRATEGEPIDAVLGDGPAGRQRCPPGGNLALVPVYSSALLLNADFEDPQALIPVGAGKRLKGWQALPASAAGLGVRLIEGPGALPAVGTRHALLGIDGNVKVGPGERALLTQEVRSPRAGHFKLTVKTCGGGSEEAYALFLQHFACRLVLFGYTDLAKDPRKVRAFATVEFRPAFADGKKGSYQTVELLRALRSQDGGANEIEMGVGVAVEVVKTTPGELIWATAAGGRPAFVRIDDVRLEFTPRPRNENKTD